MYVLAKIKKQANARLKKNPESPYFMKDAYEKYTKGINLHCPNPAINTKLHCNRAAINLKLKNYGKAIEDCKRCLEFDPNYTKAYYRYGKALIALQKYSDCQTLLLSRTEADLQELKEEVQSLITKLNSKKEVKENSQTEIESYFKAKGWKLQKRSESLPENVQIQLLEGKVSIPILFLYPEFGQFDVIAITAESQKIKIYL